MKKTQQTGKDLYQKFYGKVDESLGYSLTCKLTKNGFLISKWYARNSWVDDTLEDKVLFNWNNYKIFRNHSCVGKWK